MLEETTVKSHSKLRPPRSEQGRRQISNVAALTFALYFATLSVDAIRKVAGLPASALGIVYIITALIYIMFAPLNVSQGRISPRSLPVWLLMISAWCLAVGVIQRIPVEMALLGWASYVFFVPLLYVGAAVAADDRLLSKCLRVVVIGGGVVAAGAIISAVLGPSAPRLLQPIVPAVGFHNFGEGDIYLAPSVFADGEEAAEQLMIALFAWAALARLADGASRRRWWLFLGALIASGLIVTARRADIYVATAGIVATLILGRMRAPALAEGFAPQSAESRSNRLGAAVLLAAAGCVAVIFFLGESGLASFLTSGGSTGTRLSFIFFLPRTGSLVGQGPGTSTQGLAVVGASYINTGPIQSPYGMYILDGRTFITAEGGLSRTWLELGVMGLALYGAVFWAALAPAIKYLRKLDGAGVALTTLAIAMGIVFLKGQQSLDDPLVQPIFWLGIGGIWGRMRAGALIRKPRRDTRLRSGPPADTPMLPVLDNE